MNVSIKDIGKGTKLVEFNVSVRNYEEALNLIKLSDSSKVGD